jgi:hypothetical protein
MRFVGERCITSGLMRTSRQCQTRQQSTSLKPARQLLLASWLPSGSNRARRRRPRRSHLPQPQQPHLRRRRPRRSHLPQPQQPHLRRRQELHQGRVLLRIRGPDGWAIGQGRGRWIARWNALSTTRWQRNAALPPNIHAFSDSLCHRLRRSRSTLGSEWIDSPRPLLRTRA